MAKATINQSKASVPRVSRQFPLLQDHLVLNRYFCQLFGYQDFRALREALRDQKEGWVEDEHSYFFRVLEGHKGLMIPPDQLATYDLRIKGYVERLNLFRTLPIQLKYFQYLAVLFTEVYLDRLFTNPASLLDELNRFVEQEKMGNPSAASFYRPFTEHDLRKLAFWMATGSGKTLILHINLWQYLHYSQGKERLNNILLITPNEGLSQQHLKELRKSGIRAGRHGEAEARNLYSGGEEPSVTVIEITKLVEKKRGGGVTVEVDAFGDNNLLFVDEGHRGASGEVWRNLRQRLAERGFTFEYSATFGQMVNGANRNKRPELLEEYSKAVLFDYSYRHFYEDGYGKDYWILNLKVKDGPNTDNNPREEKDTHTQWMLLGNLVSFYQQLSVYQEYREVLRPYNLEKPLWVFVGHTVIGSQTQDDEKTLSDVQQIVLFFKDFLGHPERWTARIKDLLHGNTGLKNPNNEDIFKDLFSYLQGKYLLGKDSSSKEIYKEIYVDIVRQVFAAEPGESLRVVELKGAAGEIGLRAGDGPYFGVINIGDVAGLMKLLEAEHLKREEENFAGSLFNRINDRDSPVNVLIGSRKFMEGWDSFRVSSMGLMNIGRGEGSQIIQLFGRGVRLRGEGLSLKRSRALGVAEAVPYLPVLETLYVFGVRANYMAQFRDYLEQEGIQVNFEELHLPIQVQDSFLNSGLRVLRLPEGERFEKETGIVLKVESELKVTLDLRPRVQLARPGENLAGNEEKLVGEDKAALLPQWAPLLDWRRIYFDLLAFKRLKGFHNLAFSEATLREIVQKGTYTILCLDDQLKPLNREVALEDIRRAEDIAIAILRKYVAAYHSQERRKWEQQKVILEDLKRSDPNLAFERYTLRVERSDQKFLQSVRNLIQCANEIYTKDVKDFPNIHFDRHLYL
ncbi:DEAD/DEAH box helicase family protein, partial [Thermus caldifontis]|uniref:DEAD/DEAH box helicase family protein n=1 Tax=Thermus caldifontis TaxID=1930763 RepID=UPI000DF4C374